MSYKAQWTEFEVQALAYGILRKHLYPNYLVRGEYKFNHCRCDIAIFKTHLDREPELKLVIEVKKSAHGLATSQGERYTNELNVPHVYIRGVDDAYKVLDKIAIHLQCDPQGSNP